MQRIGETWRRLAFFFRRGKFDRDVEEEMNEHVRMKAKDFHEQGMPSGESRYAAMREFGNPLLLRERSRDAWSFGWLETCFQDVRYGLRQLRRNPGFAAVAIITLALGIGANTAIFSAIDAVILHPLPYRDPGRLMTVHQVPAGTNVNGSSIPLAPADFLALKAQNDLFTGMAAAKYSGANVTGGDQPMRVWDVTATPNLFSVLGVTPQIGRTLGPADAEHGASSAVVLGNHLWEEAFGGRRDVLGKTIQVNGESCVVVGVMPARFFDPGLYRGTYALWQPMAFTSKDRADRRAHDLYAIARLRPGVSTAEAQAELKAIGERLQKAYPEADKNMGVWAWPANKPPYMWDYVKPLFEPLYAAAIFVLIVVCVNVANLLLARGAAREHEIALRAALGACPGRLMRQFLTEGVLISVLGGAAGILLAFWGIALFKAMLPPSRLPGILDARIDLRVLVFALIVAVVAGVLFSLIPARRASRADPYDSLKQGGRGASSSAGAQRLRNTLLMAEAALALVLLFGAGVILHTFNRLMHANPGFDPHHLLIFDVGLDNTHYPDKSTWPLFFEQLTQNIASIPGVTSAAVAETAPALNDFGTAVSIHIPGARPPRNPFARGAGYNRVSPGYLQTLRDPLEKGRYFTLADDASSPPVAIVSDTLVRRYFHNENLVGKVIEVSSIYGSHHWDKSLEVVGIVHGARQYSLNQPEIPMVYVPQRQDPTQMMTVVVRTSPAPKSLIPAIRRRVAAVTTTQPVWDIGTVEESYEDGMSFQRTDVDFFGGFALITLLLAAVGVYGVTAYGVSQRFHEIGIRMALGATRKQVLRTLVKQTLGWVLLGIGIGSALLLPFERLIAAMVANSPGAKMPSTMNVHVDASLLAIVLIALAILLAAATVASLIPARRAASLDVATALRRE